jgi:hypothetical protein
MLARVPADIASDAGLAIVGTSWAREASDSLRSAGFSAKFLAELALRGSPSFDRLHASVTSGELDPQHLYAFAELTRGALLGLATYLDSTWPTPVATFSFVTKED